MGQFFPHNSRTSFRNEPIGQTFDCFPAAFKSGFQVDHRGFDFRVTGLIPGFESRRSDLGKHSEMGPAEGVPAETDEIDSKLFHDRPELVAQDRAFIEWIAFAVEDKVI
jgi:hypothetical protein